MGGQACQQEPLPAELPSLHTTVEHNTLTGVSACGSSITFYYDLQVLSHLNKIFLLLYISLDVPEEHGTHCRFQWCLFHQWLTGALFKTDFESNKAFPFCNCNLYLISVGTCRYTKRGVDSLDDFSPFSALDYNMISFGIERQTISEQCSSLARVGSNYLAEGLFAGQAECPSSSVKAENRFLTMDTR